MRRTNAAPLQYTQIATMALKSCSNCTRHTGTVMRVLIAVNFFAGLCLIIFGATVQ